MTDRRAIAIVLLVPIALWLACWPVVNLPINDDFSYSHKVLRLMQTGRLTYNGWSDAFIGVQAYWGAAFCRAFGFSHDVLRASTLPWTIACAAIAYGLNRRLGIGPRWSLFATLALVASPLVTPWSASFMTDVQGLTLWLGVLHGAASLARARSTRQTLVAAATVALFGLVGGSVRQVPLALAGVLLGIEFVRRLLAGRSTRTLDVPGLAILIAWGATLVIAAAALSIWTARQPYSVADGWPDHRRLIAGASAMLALSFALASYALPVSLALLFRDGWRSLSLTAWLPLPVLLICCTATTVALGGDSRWSSLARVPFVDGTLTPTGLTTAGLDTPGQRPIVFPLALRVGLAAVSLWTIAVAATRVDWRRARATWQRIDPTLRSFAIVSAVYAAMIYPRATHGWTFDRYLLVVLPIAFACAIRAADPRRGPGAIGWATLVAFALAGVVTTNDHFREMRARLAIAGDFEARGIDRTRYSNGLTFDAWTQMMAWGYINDFRIHSPADAYKYSDVLWARRKVYYFLQRTPAITPEWIVDSALARPAADAPNVAAVWSYAGLFPPGRRWLVVRSHPLETAGQPFTKTPVEPPAMPVVD